MNLYVWRSDDVAYVAVAHSIAEARSAIVGRVGVDYGVSDLFEAMQALDNDPSEIRPCPAAVVCDPR
jgi:hypothetical protein